MTNIVNKNSFTIFENIKDNDSKIQSNSLLINEMVKKKSVNISINPFSNDKDKERASITTTIMSTVDITNDPNILVVDDNFEFDAFDKMILDSALNIGFRSVGFEDTFITPQDIIRNYSGNLKSSDTISPTRVEEVRQRIEKMLNNPVKINCKEEMIARNVRSQNLEGFLRPSKILPLDRAEVHLKNGTKINGYVVSQASLLTCPLTRYIICTKQIITISNNKYGAIGMRDNDEADIIQAYMLGRIETMKHKHNRQNSNRIRFDSYDKTNETGLYNYCGIFKENYTNKSWMNKQNKVITIIKNILDYQKELKSIKSYEFIYEANRKIPYAVDLKF